MQPWLDWSSLCGPVYHILELAIVLFVLSSCWDYTMQTPAGYSTLYWVERLFLFCGGFC